MIKKTNIYIYIYVYIFNYHNPKGIKLLSRLRLGLSHFREHSSNTASKILSTPSTDVEKLKLKLVLTIFSTV